MNNSQRHAIIEYLGQGEKFSDLIIRELGREDITDSEKRTYSSLLDAILGATELYCYMTDWPDNVEVFIPKDKRNIKSEKETAIVIEHGPVTMEIAMKLGEFVKGLPLSVEQNDKLVYLMRDQLLMAEHEQYIAGFSECMNVVHDGGFKGLEDKLLSLASHENE